MCFVSVGDGVLTVECSRGECVVATCEDDYEVCPTGCCQWTETPVDEANNSAGWRVEAMFDANGVLHAAYEVGAGREVRYARWENGAWTVETVENTAEHPALGVDPTGIPHLVFGATGPDRVVHAVRTGNDMWDIDDIDTRARPTGTSLVVDATGRPHVAYSLLSTPLTYATLQADVWNTTELTGVMSSRADIFIRRDVPWICFANDTFAVQCAQQPTNWNPAPIANADGDFADHKPRLSAALRNETVYTSYLADGGGLVLSRLDPDNSVTTEFIDATSDSGAASVLRFDAEFNAHIAYTTPNTGVLYAVERNGLWRVLTVKDVLVANQYIAMDLDANGMPHILFFDENSDRLVHFQLQ